MKNRRRQIVIDTETTGLEHSKGHRIIEVGCIELVNRRLTGNNFHYYINPQRNIDNEALSVHGITSEFLNDKPLFVDIAHKLYDFMVGAEVIAHNASFDIGFLDAEFALADKRTFKHLANCCKIIDTLKIARNLHPGQRNSLDALCKRYNIDNSKRQLHGALLDAQILAQVYLAMTGGQSSIFGDLELQINNDKPKSIEKAISTDKTYNLTVTQLNPDEKNAHSEFLQQLSAKSKKQIQW